MNEIYREYDVIARPATYGRCNLEAQEHTDQGLRVLQKWPDRVMCGILIKQYLDVADVMSPEQVIYLCHESIWSTYGSALSHPRQSEQLFQMSCELCTTMSPMAPASNTQE